ncbi:UVB-resistance protein [Bdellovibrio sp. HCB274]|uniref:UVB-resistance protein n=1 Tax=Bdellovibrio sp. HCB274 TaxID=3394361 RepID=UPI0039B4042C
MCMFWNGLKNSVLSLIAISLLVGCSLSLDIHGLGSGSFASKLSPPSINQVTADITGISSASGMSILSVPRATTAQVIPISVEFDRAMDVTGNPTLELSTGSTLRKANYVSGSGTATLIFEYTVVAGDSAPTLDYTGNSALSLNGGEILPTNQQSSFTAQEILDSLKLPDPGTAKSLAGTTPVLVNTVPEVKSMKSPDTDVYLDGTSLEVIVKYDQPVTVTGSPRLQIKVGSNTRNANYVAQISASELLFRYTVVNGDDDTNGIELPPAIDLNGATILNPANEVAVSTLPVKDTSNVLTYTSILTASFVSSTQTVVVGSSAVDIQIPVVLSASAPIPFKVALAVMGEAIEGVDYQLSPKELNFIKDSSIQYVSLKLLSHATPGQEKRLRLVLAQNQLGTGGPLSLTEINIHDENLAAPKVVDYKQGMQFGCALYDNKDLKCLGSNTNGQLGNGTLVDSDKVSAISVLTNVTAFDIKNEVVCATNLSGEMWCWGKGYGVLSFAGGYSATPQKIVSSDAVKPVMTSTVICYLNTSKNLVCWGRDFHGALGQGVNEITISQSSPITISGPFTDADIMSSNGGDLFCALKENSSIPSQTDLYCWGYKSADLFASSGKINTFPTTPDVTNVKSFRLSYQMANLCIQRDDSGSTKNFCWGQNVFKTLSFGTGSSTASLTPVEMIQDSSGRVYSEYLPVFNSICGIKSDDRSVWCWGTGVPQGPIATAGPVQVVQERAVRFLNISYNHSRCVLTEKASVICWEESTTGAYVLNPQTVINSSVESIGLHGDGSHACITLTGGQLSCWGYNNYGQVGDRTQVTRLVPTMISSKNIKQVVVGGGGTCSVSTYGELRCWGEHSSRGSLGAGTPTSRYILSPLMILEKDVVKVVMSYSGGCALMSTGALKCWGKNDFGQARPDNTTDQPSPYEVFASGVKDVAVMDSSSCYLNTEGEVRCWGRNTNGELGLGNYASFSGMPTNPILTDVQSIYAGGRQSSSQACGIKTNGDMYCWGVGFGLGLTTTPTKMLENVKKVAFGGYSSMCVIVGDDRALKCWGENSSGELGDGTKVARPFASGPVTVVTSGVKDVASGPGYNCFVLEATGEMKCMGGKGHVFATGESTKYAKTVYGL